MRKSTKMVKKLIALFLVVLMSIESFGAVVSDNDGSAFITKAEYDSLKNDFQSQLDTYNTSIDSKIDDAVAKYLSGLAITSDPDNLWEKYVELTGEKPVFIQEIDRGTESTNELNLSVTYYINIKKANNLKFVLFSGDPSTQFYAMVHTAANPIGDWHNAIRGVSTLNSQVAFDTISWGTYGTTPDSSEWYNVNDSKKLVTYGIKTFTNTYSNTFTDGSGTKWLFQKIGEKKYLKYYCTRYYLKNDITYVGNFYKDFPWSDTNYLTNNGKKINITLPTTVVQINPGGITTIGTKQSETYQGINRYIEGKNYIIKTTDGANYLNSFFSFTSDVWVRAYDEIYGGDVGAAETTYVIPKQKYTDVYYTQSGGQTQQNDIVEQTLKLRLPVLLNDDNSGNHNLNEFYNEAMTSITGDSVTVVSGIPIIKTNDEQVNEIKIGIKLSSTNNNQVNVIIADEKFNYGHADANSIKWNGTINTNASDYVYVNLNVTGKKNIYMFLKNNTNNENIVVDDICLIK